MKKSERNKQARCSNKSLKNFVMCFSDVTLCFEVDTSKRFSKMKCSEHHQA